jgi:hypothetical protein
VNHVSQIINILVLGNGDPVMNICVFNEAPDSVLNHDVGGGRIYMEEGRERLMRTWISGVPKLPKRDCDNV